MVFEGAPGAADDVSVPPLRAKKKYVDARVPAHRGHRPGDARLHRRRRVRPHRRPAHHRPDAGGAEVDGRGLGIDVEVQGNRVFYGAERQAQVSYIVRDNEPVTVAVELVRLSDGVAITRWEPGAVTPGVPQTIDWDGTADGKVQKDGRYAFRVFATSASGATASSAQATAPGTPAKAVPGSFLFQRNIFPIRGSHYFGTGRRRVRRRPRPPGPGRLRQVRHPAGRRPRRAREVQAYQSAAGNYLVIDGDHTGYDFAYMHMREAALVDQGDHVYTGQPIGFVGDTGHADGCHLHFEAWTAPGVVLGRLADRPAADAVGVGQDVAESPARTLRDPRRS